MKVRVFFQAVTSAHIDVEIPDDTTEDELDEVAIEAAHGQGVPGLCAQCSGWRQHWSKDEGEWEAIAEEPVQRLEESGGEDG